MNFRIAEILAEEDIGASGTKSIDINISKAISKISINWKFTTATALANTAHPVDCLTKIELMDGSDALFSLTGQEAQALNFYNGKSCLGNVINVDAATTQRAVVDIDFGRYLWDKELAFDPSQFANPQLKVTFDEDAANGSAVANGLEVLGYVFDGAQPTPQGFLSAKEHYAYTPAASAHEYIVLPTDRIIRNMLFRCKTTDVDPVSQISKIKLSENNDDTIPFDVSALNLLRIDELLRGKVQEYVTNDLVVTASDFYVTPAQDVQVTPVNTGDVTTASAEFPSITIANTHVSLGATITSVRNKTIIEGLAPHSCLNMPCGVPSDIETWYSPIDLGSLRADILTTSDDQTGGAVAVVLESLRSY